MSQVKMYELHKRTVSVTRENISALNYLLYANECLENVSEIARKQAMDIEVILSDEEYEYIIMSDNSRLLRYVSSITEANDFLYYDMAGSIIEMDWIPANELSETPIVVAGVSYVLLILDVLTVSGESQAMRLATTEDVKNYIYKTLSGAAYTEPVDVGEIEQALTVKSSSVALPTDFQEIIQVLGASGTEIFQFKQQGFTDETMLTSSNEPVYGSHEHIFYITDDETIVSLKSKYLDSSQIGIKISYFKQLKTYDIVEDIAGFDSLTIPLENTYKNLINYYATYKFYQSWQDIERAQHYYSLFSELKAEYKEATERKFNDLLPTEVKIVRRFE